jgi:hypothetical protein
MDVIGLKEHEFTIPIESAITIGKTIYAEALIICRLLTIAEIKHIDRWT